MFDENTKKALKNMGGNYLRGSDFEGGLTLQFKSVEKISGQYGAEADSSMVEKGILEEGQKFRFTFADSDGVKRTFDTTSMPFTIALNQVEINEDDWVEITREGKGDKTRYHAEKVSEPTGSKPPKSDVDLDGIPF